MNAVAVAFVVAAAVAGAATLVAFIYKARVKSALARIENLKSTAEADVKRVAAEGKTKVEAVKNELRKHVDALEASATKDEHAAKADVAEVAKKIKGLL